jgi:Dna[CI] antecedent, DciA
MERIDGDVRRELSRFGPAAGFAKLVEAWPAAVGEAIARNAWPARFQRDGTLIVHTSAAAWAFELMHLERSIKEQLGELAPGRLRFIPGPLPEAEVPSPAQATRQRVEPTAEERASAASLAAPIGDRKLRKLVARAAAASLAGARSGRQF